MTKQNQKQKQKQKKKTTQNKKTKKTAKTLRTRNKAQADVEAPVGASWTDILYGALPVLATLLTAIDGDDEDDDTEHAPMCRICGRVLELPGADHDRAPSDWLTPLPSYRDLGALFTKLTA